MTKFTIILAWFLIIPCMIANADKPPLTEAEVKERTDAISKTLRCVVCQNQSIYDSNAPLANDMRRLVEERVRAGDSNEEVREYLRGPYGDFILMRPPFQLNTLALWLGPIALGLLFFVWYIRRGGTPKSATSHKEMSEENRKRVHEALRGEDAE